MRIVVIGGKSQGGQGGQYCGRGGQGGQGDRYSGRGGQLCRARPARDALRSGA